MTCPICGMPSKNHCGIFCGKCYWAKYRSNEKYKAQKRISDKKYQLTHKEQIAAQKREYNKIYLSRSEVKEKIKQRMKIYNCLPYVKEKRKLAWQTPKSIAWRKAYAKSPMKIFYLKKYYLIHKDRILHNVKKRALENRDLILKQKREYVIRPTVKVRIKEYQRLLRRENIYYKLRGQLDWRLKEFINKNGVSSSKLLGYNSLDLKEHLEKQFTPEMNWDNRGIYWEIDHKVPLSWFKTREQLLKKGFSLDNIQPLPKKLNRLKGRTFVYDLQKNGLPVETIYL